MGEETRLKQKSATLLENLLEDKPRRAAGGAVARHVVMSSNQWDEGHMMVSMDYDQPPPHEEDTSSQHLSSRQKARAARPGPARDDDFFEH